MPPHANVVVAVPARNDTDLERVGVEIAATSTEVRNLELDIQEQEWEAYRWHDHSPQDYDDLESHNADLSAARERHGELKQKLTDLRAQEQRIKASL